MGKKHKKKKGKKVKPLAKPDEIFVFASDMLGRHMKNSALFARKRKGAQYGKGSGIQGESYAIPTVDAQSNRMSFKNIWVHVEMFFRYAERNPDKNFVVSPTAMGANDYSKPFFIGMFQETPDNVRMVNSWYN